MLAHTLILNMKQIPIVLLALALALSAQSAETSPKKSTVEKSDKPAAKSVKPTETPAALTPTQGTKLLELLNKGTDEELATLPGLGATRLAAVKKARPIKEVPDLLNVEGIGEATFNDIIAHAKAGFPTDKPAKSDAKPKKAKAGKKADPAKSVKKPK
jgi:DNA uptake protein ComE-like DNA-binding protein